MKLSKFKGSFPQNRDTMKANKGENPWKSYEKHVEIFKKGIPQKVANHPTLCVTDGGELTIAMV